MTSQNKYDNIELKHRKTEKKEEGSSLAIAESNEPVASGLKFIIAQKGLKNGFVAEKSGFAPQEFSDMLNGRRLIRACDIPKLASVLGVKTDDIYAAGGR